MNLKKQLEDLENIFNIKFKVFKEKDGSNHFSFEFPKDFDFNDVKSISLREVNLLNYLIIYYEHVFADFSQLSVDKFINEVFNKTNVNILDNNKNNVLMNEVLHLKEESNALTDEQYDYLLKNTNLFNENKFGKSYFDLLIERDSSLCDFEVDFLLTQDINKLFEDGISLADKMSKIPLLLDELTQKQEMAFIQKLDLKNYNLVKHFMINSHYVETIDYLVKNADFSLLDKNKNMLIIDILKTNLTDKILKQILQNKKISFKKKNDIGNFTQILNKENIKINKDCFDLIQKQDPLNCSILIDQIKDIGYFKKFLLTLQNILNKKSPVQEDVVHFNAFDDLSFITSPSLKKIANDIKELNNFYEDGLKNNLISNVAYNDFKSLYQKSNDVLKNVYLHKNEKIQQDAKTALETILNNIKENVSVLEEKSTNQIKIMRKTI